MKTLFIGLGGCGRDVLKNIRKYTVEMTDDRLANWRDYLFMAVDQDPAGLDELIHQHNIPCADIRLMKTAQECVEAYPKLQVQQWLPALDGPIAHIGQNRAAGRMAFLAAVEDHLLQDLEARIDRCCSDGGLHVSGRIVIINSLAGGLGSGAFIQLALWVRSYLKQKNYWNTQLCSVLVGPEVFIETAELGQFNPSTCSRLRSNAYAAIQELEQVTNDCAGTGIGWDWLTDRCAMEDGRVFDQVYLYDPVGEKLSYSEHMIRVARGAFFSSDPMVIHQTLASTLPIGQLSPLKLNVFSTSVAAYRSQTALEYCDLHALQKLLLPKEPVTADPEEIAERAGEFQKRITEKAEKAVQEQVKCAGLEKVRQINADEPVELYLNDILETLRVGEDQLRRQIPAICKQLIKKLTFPELGDNRETIFMLFRNQESQCVAPCCARNVIAFVLTNLKVQAMQPLSAGVCLEDQGPERLNLGKTQVASVAGYAYPQVLWEAKNKEVLFQRKKLRECYLQWLDGYCGWYIRELARECTAKVLKELAFALLGELSDLLLCMEQVDEQLRRELEGSREKYIAEKNPLDTLSLCSDGDWQDAFCREHPMIREIFRVYRIYAEQMSRYRLEGTDSPDRGAEIMKGILMTVRHIIRSKAPVAAGYSLIDAWLQSGGVDADAPEQVLDQRLEELVRRLRLVAIQTGAAADQAITVVGFSKNLPYSAQLHRAAERADGVYASLRDTWSQEVMWCIRVVPLQPAAECRILQEERYRDACLQQHLQAESTGNGRMEPYADKRLATALIRE